MDTQTNTYKVANNANYKNDTLKVGTAFSGIGAPEEAIKNIKINHINEFMIEIDKNAKKTYLANHSVNNIFSDITKINPKTIPDIDLFIFGSPCQSYSVAGHRLGMEDTRGTLVFNGLQIIKEKQPSYFVYENVKGMINHDKGHTFAVIKAAFEELNYNIKYEVLNAKNYGAAQNRERLFIVGIRKDIKQDFNFPEPQAVNNNVSNYIVKGADYSDYIINEKKLEKFIPKKQVDIKTVFTIPRLNYNADKKITSTSGISPCLLAGAGRHKFYDKKNKLLRYLSENELQQIQGFGKDFKFPVSKTQIRKQIGNSIYVGVLEAILKNLIPEAYIETNSKNITTKKGNTMQNTTTITTNLNPEVATSSNIEFTAKNTKLFPYSGSKLKYQDKFTEVHSKVAKNTMKKVKYYIEAFSGTLSSLFHNLKHVEADTIVVNDINTKLINLYSQIKSNSKEVFSKYKQLEDEFKRITPDDLQNIRLIKKSDREKFIANKEFYYEARHLMNTIEDSTNKAALTIFVLNHNFNGLYGENKKQEMNIAFNWSSKLVNVNNIEVSINNLHKFFTTNNVVFESLHSTELMKKYDDADTFIYLDPPYINSDIQYTTKNKESFSDVATHISMLQECSKYKFVLYSNNHNEDIDLFDEHINFSRSNKVSKKDNKQKLEILAFIINDKKVVKAIPIIELLQINIDASNIKPVNNIVQNTKQSKDISTLLNINNVSKALIA